MRACMLAYSFYESDNRVRRYAETLVNRGDRVDAIALRRPGQPRLETIAGVRVHRIQMRERNEKTPLHYLLKLLSFWLRSAWVVSCLHMESRFSLIHVHSVPDFQVFATFLPRLLGAKVILDIHDIVPEFYASKFKVKETSIVFGLLAWIERLSARFSNHVIIANHLWHAKLVKRSVPPERCTTIINYPDLSIFRNRGAKQPGGSEFVMCYPGTLNWHQGVDRAVLAVDSLREKLPHLRFRIIGSGPDRDSLTALIRRRRLEDRVSVEDSVPIEEIAATMAAVDLGVVPKRRDSFGNEAFSTKIMEFMAMGVPVLASDTRVDRYYFSEELVQFFDSDRADDLAAKIHELATDAGKRAALRTRGLDFVQENNWGVMSHQYCDLVDSLLRQAALR